MNAHIRQPCFDLDTGSACELGSGPSAGLGRLVATADRIFAHMKGDQAAYRVDAMMGALARGDNRVIRAARNDGLFAFNPGPKGVKQARVDAATIGPGNSGFYRPEDLTQWDPQVTREILAPLNRAEMIAVEPIMHPGMETFKPQYEKVTSGVKVSRDGPTMKDVPLADVARSSDEYHRVFLTSAWQKTWAQKQAEAAVGYGMDDGKEFGAMHAHEEWANTGFFNGHPALGIYGLANGRIMRQPMAVTMGPGSGTTGASAEQRLREAIAAVHTLSKGAMRPNRMATSLRLKNWLVGPRSDGSDESILGRALEVSDDITGLEAYHELENLGGPGVDYLIIYSDDPRDMVYGEPMTPTPLPQIGFMDAWSEKTYILSAHIGLIIRRANAIIYEVTYVP